MPSVGDLCCHMSSNSLQAQIPDFFVDKMSKIRLIPLKPQDKSVEVCGSESRKSLGQSRSFRSLHALCLGKSG